jgi:hypothetical protein
VSVTAKTITFICVISITTALKITNNPEPPIFCYDLSTVLLTAAALSRNLYSFIHIDFDVVHAFHEADPVVAKMFELRSRATTYKDTDRQKDTMFIAFEYQSSMNQTHERFERELYQAALKMNVTNKQVRFLQLKP